MIDVGEVFSTRLVNSNNFHGDGTHTALEFRYKYLSELDSTNAWKDESTSVGLDFSKVVKISPSFANEAFAYFTKYVGNDYKKIFSKIVFTNI